MRIYLAGIETRFKSQKFTHDLSESYCLESFFYAKKLVKTLEAKDILIDSGAFSLMGGKKVKQDLNDYVNDYAKFLKEYDIKHYLELDIETIKGMGFVEEVRQFLEKETNKPSIPVWHVHRGLDYFKKMCNDYDYIAIGGLFDFRDYDKMIPLIRYAHLHKTKVHGLGFTKTTMLNRFHFDSVDSTTWLSGSMYAKAHYFDKNAGKLVIYDKPKGKKMKNYKLTDNYNLEQWIRFGKWAERNL